MVGTIVLEENGFPVELGSEREIERAVVTGRLRPDTIVRTGIESGVPHASAAGEVAWLRPYLGLPDLEAPRPAPAATEPGPMAARGPSSASTTARSSGLPDRAADPAIARPAAVSTAPTRAPSMATVTTTPRNESRDREAWRAQVRSATGSPYVEPDGVLGRAFMPLARYATFEGRSSPREFWAFILLVVAVVVLANASGGTTAMGLAILAATLPTAAVAIRRLHDQDRSGWFALVAFIPYIGWLVLLVMMMIRGTPGLNRFGTNPMMGS